MKQTFSGTQTDRLAVGTVAGLVKRLHTSDVASVKMQPLHRTDRLLATEHFLQTHASTTRPSS